MKIIASAIICASRAHGETGAVVRAMTSEYGMLAGYVQGARGRHLRPVLIPGNVITGTWNVRILGQLPSLAAEPEHSRAHLLGEPLAVAAIDWVTALTAATLPEGDSYPHIHSALDGVLTAVELSPAARRWAGAVAQYEEILLSQLGYAQQLAGHTSSKEPAAMAAANQMSANRARLVEHVLGDRRADVMAARERLVERLKRAT